jgi:hypothetical protein
MTPILTLVGRGHDLAASADRVTLAGVTIEGPGVGRGVYDALSKQIGRLLAEHGLAAFEHPKRATCLHEAGHAVVLPWLGKTVTKITISQRPDGWIGYTHWAEGAWCVDPGNENASSALIAVSRNLYAGLAAETLFAGNDLREGSSIDELIMSQAAAQAARDGRGEALWQQEVHYPVCQHLRRNEHVVRRIAGYLLEHRKMQGRPLQIALGEVRW